MADNATAYRPKKHDGLIYYECLCLRRKSLERRLLKILPDVKIDEVIDSLVKRHALKLVKDKRTVKISKLDKSIGAQRFYAIKLELVEK